MEKEFWLNKWNQNSIGFHRSEYHPELLKYITKFEELEKSVLVPLCGKSLDLIYLKDQGFNVVGIEFSKKACEEFFNENNIEYQIITEDGFEIFESDKIHLYCGDYFKFVPREKLNFAYDRAAIVALDPNNRKAYADQYAKNINAGGKLLMLTFEYDQSKCQGPPWSTEEYFIYEYFEKEFDIDILENSQIKVGNPRMQEAGVSTALQKTFLLTKK
ncbi:MAG: hypothetical protein CME70_01195 [Halobacteriovorax sp.]|nr:hypothetical protein [Halobacteriovorax sp.]|tara:strand:- start:55425 stop:56072 length:648 start_codon:yes stop_codon:yes gene_type:complete